MSLLPVVLYQFQCSAPCFQAVGASRSVEGKTGKNMETMRKKGKTDGQWAQHETGNTHIIQALHDFKQNNQNTEIIPEISDGSICE